MKYLIVAIALCFGCAENSNRVIDPITEGMEQPTKPLEFGYTFSDQGFTLKDVITSHGRPPESKEEQRALYYEAAARMAWYHSEWEDVVQFLTKTEKDWPSDFNKKMLRYAHLVLWNKEARDSSGKYAEVDKYGYPLKTEWILHVSGDSQSAYEEYASRTQCSTEIAEKAFVRFRYQFEQSRMRK